MDKSKISVILSERVGVGVGAKDPRTNPGADPRSSQRSFAPLGPTHPSLRMTQNLQCFFSQVQRSLCEKAQDDTWKDWPCCLNGGAPQAVLPARPRE